MQKQPVEHRHTVGEAEDQSQKSANLFSALTPISSIWFTFSHKKETYLKLTISLHMVRFKLSLQKKERERKGKEREKYVQGT